MRDQGVPSPHVLPAGLRFEQEFGRLPVAMAPVSVPSPTATVLLGSENPLPPCHIRPSWRRPHTVARFSIPCCFPEPCPTSQYSFLRPSKHETLWAAISFLKGGGPTQVPKTNSTGGRESLGW